jgi:hypothetical protein
MYRFFAKLDKNRWTVFDSFILGSQPVAVFVDEYYNDGFSAEEQARNLAYVMSHEHSFDH